MSTKFLGRLWVHKKAEDIDSASSSNSPAPMALVTLRKRHFHIYFRFGGEQALPLLKQRGEYSFFGKTVSYSGTTTYTPQYGIAGSYSGYGVLQHLSKICNA